MTPVLRLSPTPVFDWSRPPSPTAFPVVPLPGASAALSALVASGLPCDEFRFIGFLPPKQNARRKVLERLRAEAATTIAYESPHRVLDSLADMADVLGARPVVVARELTKLYEELLRGTPASVLAELQSRPSVKGEITLVIGGGHQEAPANLDPVQEVSRLQAEEGLDRMEAIKTVAKLLGLPKREVYRLVEQK